MLYQLKNCRKCHGDLVLEGDEWRCWQCGHYYYPRLEKGTVLEKPPDPIISDLDSLVETPPPTRVTRSLRDINSAIAARDRSDKRWWIRNMQIIRWLDEGRTVKEIARAVGRGPRQVRVVREKLYDLRSSGVGEIMPD